MQIVEALSEQGIPDKNNEDIWGHTDFAAWVFDGATGLSAEQIVAEDGRTDPRWIVEAAHQSLLIHADRIEDIHALYAAVLADVETAFKKQARRIPENPAELPMAASLVIRRFHGRVICGALSDCTFLIENKTGGLDVMPACSLHARIDKTTKAGMLAAVESGLSPEEARQAIIPQLRENRRLANMPGGYTVFAPDRNLADYVRIEMFTPPAGGYALLMSDGFYALVEQYGLYSDQTLIEAAKTRGLKPLYSELRRIEDEDSSLRKFPRFKKSDDATAVLVRF